MGREVKGRSEKPLATRVNDNYLKVSKKAKSCNEIPDNNGKIFILCVEETKLFVQHLFFSLERSGMTHAYFMEIMKHFVF